MKKTQYILFVLCMGLCFSCAVDESCRTNQSVLMDIGMYHVTQTDTSRTVASMSIDSITVRGLKYDAATKKYSYMDSVLYNNLKTILK